MQVCATFLSVVRQRLLYVVSDNQCLWPNKYAFSLEKKCTNRKDRVNRVMASQKIHDIHEHCRDLENSNQRYEIMGWQRNEFNQAITCININEGDRKGKKINDAN